MHVLAGNVQRHNLDDRKLFNLSENSETCPTESLNPKKISKLLRKILASDIFTYQDVDYLLITDRYSVFF